MVERFTLRFVLPATLPTLPELRHLWEDDWRLDYHDDGVVVLTGDPGKLVQLDVLRADDPRGHAIIAGLAQKIEGRDDEAAETVRFMLEGAAGVVVASPFADVEPDDALAPLDVLWSHLFEEYGGLLQVDREGFYGEEGLLVEL